MIFILERRGKQDAQLAMAWGPDGCVSLIRTIEMLDLLQGIVSHLKNFYRQSLHQKTLTGKKRARHQNHMGELEWRKQFDVRICI